MEEWCTFYNMPCYKVPEEIIIIDNDYIYCDAVCDLACKSCIYCKEEN